MAYRSQWGVFFRPTDLDLSAAIPQAATLDRREAETLYLHDHRLAVAAG